MNHDDIQFFHEAIGATRGEVRRIPHHGKVVHSAKKPVAKRQTHSRHQDSSPAKLPYFSDHDPYAAPTHENESTLHPRTELHRASLPAPTLRRLRQGKLRIEANLDLHGCPVEEARLRVAWLLQQPASGRYPGEPLCVRIVHGIGYNSPHGIGKIKRLLAIWLPQSERVLAFCTARPNDGGQGALYVLLRSAP